MLFEIAVLAFAVITPCAVFLAYRRGLKDGMSIRKHDEIKPIAKPFMTVQPPNDDNITKLMENINTYDGTARGQTDIG